MKQPLRYGATEGALGILEKIEESLKSSDSWKNLGDNLLLLSTEALEKRPTSALLVNTLRSLLMFAIEKYTEGADLEDFKEEFFRKIKDVKMKTLEAVEKLSDIGARWLPESAVVLTHSYSNSVIKTLQKASKLGKIREVLVTESRPGGEGIYTARLLSSMGIKTNLIVDSAVNYFMSNVDFVLLGAEAITAHGALVNKVGSSQISLSAYKRRTRVIVVSGTYKFSFETLLGERIRVPFMDAAILEIPTDMLSIGTLKVSIPQMDITPPEYIDAIVTEVGITSPEGVPILLWEVFGEWLGKQPEISELLSELKKIN
jgi:translation initiation factor 2B subunit (eIF-2B alpha/beta/delta family)